MILLLFFSASLSPLSALVHDNVHGPLIMQQLLSVRTSVGEMMIC